MMFIRVKLWRTQLQKPRPLFGADIRQSFPRHVLSSTVQTRHRLRPLASCSWPQRALALLRSRNHSRRKRPKRIACERGTDADLRNANTVTEWLRFAPISRASARTGIRSKGRETRRLGQGEPVKYWEIIADRLHAEG